MNNYHTHAKYCKHGEGNISEYVKNAVEANIQELGFTCHIPFEKSFLNSDYYKDIMINANKNNANIQPGRESRMDYFEIDQYLNDIEQAKKKFPNIKLLSGFECEYDEANKDFIEKISSKVDYLIIGMHHVFKDSTLYDFTKKYVVSKNEYRKLTYDDLDVYAEACINGMKSGLFTILAHPDFFMDKVEDFTDKCEEVSRRIIEAAIKYDVYLEINTSDYWKANKKNRRLMYPRKEFWNIVGQYKGVKVVIGTDAHKPERVCDFQLDKVEKIIKENNLNVVTKIVLK